MSEVEEAPEGVDTTKPSAARLYDYYLGGTANYEVDRAAAEKIRAKVPELTPIAWANRGFLQRATRWLAEEAGIRQFIDLGAGLPTQNNTHDAAQRVAPDARVVYVDHDPLVLVHARQLLGPREAAADRHRRRDLHPGRPAGPRRGVRPPRPPRADRP